MNCLRAASIGIWLLGGAASGFAAQSAGERCGFGDAACYERQRENACAIREVATPERCTALIAAIEAYASRDDRAARHAVAHAHIALGTHLGQDPDGQSSSIAAATAIHRQLLLTDPSDTEAMLGIATFTDDPAERVDLLRRVVVLQPHPITVEALARELARTGRPEDLLEAAQTHEWAYSVNEGRTRWRHAAGAIRHFAEAGLHDRARAFRERARRDLAEEGLLDELSQILRVDAERIAGILRLLCAHEVHRSVGVDFCIDGLDAVLAGVREVEDRALAGSIADVAVDVLGGITLTQWEGPLTEADPDWHARVARWLDGVASQGLASVNGQWLRAMLESDPDNRVAMLQQTLRSAPENPRLFETLASEYMQQQRWDDALDMYRRARELSTTDDQRRGIDRNIETAQRVRDAARGSSPRR